MSPVSPTLVPAVSSLIRSGSPSKLSILMSSEGVFVRNTTNSWGIVPALETENVTGPAARSFVDGVTAHWSSVTETFCPAPAVDDAPAADGGVLPPLDEPLDEDDEQAGAIINVSVTNATDHRCSIIV